MCVYIHYRHGCDRMVVGFTTTYAISAYHHWCCEFESRSGRGVKHYVMKFVSDLRQVSGFLQVLRFPPPIKLTTVYGCLYSLSVSYCFLSNSDQRSYRSVHYNYPGLPSYQRSYRSVHYNYHGLPSPSKFGRHNKAENADWDSNSQHQWC
jgi:hypothetical protein